MPRDTDDKFDREFAPVSAGSQTDLELLPKRFDAFANEVRSALEMLIGRLEPKLDRIIDTVRDYGERIGALEAARHDADRRHDETSRRLYALESSISKPRARTPRK